MASSCLHLLLLFSFLRFHLPAKCDSDDPEGALLQGINSYRTSLNLKPFTKNDNAECFADEIADQFKGQPCTNTTGANTLQGTEPQFSNYPELLAKCHLNVSDTRDGSIMPACVPNLASSLVLTNFTQSQYSGSLNDSKYTGAGVGSDGDWIVVVLTTSTSEGSFVTYNAASLTTKIDLFCYLLFWLVGVLLMF